MKNLQAMKQILSLKSGQKFKKVVVNGEVENRQEIRTIVFK